MLHKIHSKNTPYSGNPHTQIWLGGLEHHWKAAVASPSDFPMCSEPASQRSSLMLAVPRWVLCHIIVVFIAPSLLRTEPLQLHLHSSFTMEIARIIGGWFIKKSFTKAEPKSEV